jgi:cytochrome bd-type quinol oxidase subunit 1
MGASSLAFWRWSFLDRPPRVEDLRRDRGSDVRFEVSMTTSLIIGASLLISGTLIALVVPELFAEGEGAKEENDRELAVLLALTMEEVATEEGTLTNVPYGQVLLLVAQPEGPVPGLDVSSREFGREMLPLVLQDDIPYRLRVISPSKTSPAWELVSTLDLPNDRAPSIQTLEVGPSTLSDESGPVTVTLEIWNKGAG